MSFIPYSRVHKPRNEENPQCFNPVAFETPSICGLVPSKLPFLHMFFVTILVALLLMLVARFPGYQEVTRFFVRSDYFSCKAGVVTPREKLPPCFGAFF